MGEHYILVKTIAHVIAHVLFAFRSAAKWLREPTRGPNVASILLDMCICLRFSRNHLGHCKKIRPAAPQWRIRLCQLSRYSGLWSPLVICSILIICICLSITLQHSQLNKKIT